MKKIIELKFETEQDAETKLVAAGFCLGTIQRDDPRAIMFGYGLVEKWRNISQTDRANIHGIYQRLGRGGPVEVTIFNTCPAEGIAAIEKLRAKVS